MQRFLSLGPAFVLATVAVALQACGGSGGVSPGGSPTGAPLALLVPGTTNQYSGTQTVAITLASPTPKTPNSNASYTTAETDAISLTGSGAPAPFDVHRVITYTTVAAPSFGIQRATETFDDFENVNTSNGSQTVTLAQAVEALSGTNVTSVLASGGTGAYTDNTTTSYSPIQILAIYPLATGATFNQSLARTVTSSASTATASGTLTSALTTTYQGDDSYIASGTLTNGDSTSRTENPDGSATQTDIGPSPLTQTIGVPTNASGSYAIPISSNGNASSIADYYPSNGLPPSPLGLTSVTVVGPASSLPSGCPAAGTYPNVIEVDSSASALDVLAGSVSATTTRSFNSNGLQICRTAVATTNNYSLQTGLLRQTTVTNTQIALTSSTTSSKQRSPAAR